MGHEITDFLAYVGLAFISGSVFVLVGGYVQLARRHKPINPQAVVRGLGYVATWLWCLIGAGIAAWLVSIPFALLTGAHL